jgi:hypothetical protein
MLFAILIRIPEFFRSLFSRAANAARSVRAFATKGIIAEE